MRSSCSALLVLAACAESASPASPALTPPAPLASGVSVVVVVVAPLPAGTLTSKPVGSPVPGFTRKSASGETVTALRGHVIVVDFWATWCNPCKQSMPELQAIWQRHHGRGLDVIGVSVDDDGSGVADFGRDNKIQFPLVWDEGRAITSAYNPTSMPTTFVVDRTGIVRFVHAGFSPGGSVGLEKEIESLL